MYIRKAADQLSELVNDLLDLAKVEAGKIAVRPATFAIDNLFGALRGMLRPLLVNQSVALVLEEPDGLPPMFTDEAKVSQILRNLISNALKFTEKGEVRVSARLSEDGSAVVFAVIDTGIGIAKEDQARIFEEFTQLEHRLQRQVKGTGLGLPLSKRLAELLGGSLSVASEPGVGSTFTAVIPVRYAQAEAELHAPADWRLEDGRVAVLVIDDAPDAQFMFEKLLKGSRFQPYPAASVDAADAALTQIRPAAVILDLVLASGDAWDFLTRIKRDEHTRATPVIVVSSLDEREKALALGAEAYFVKPVDRRPLVDTLEGLTASAAAPVRVLMVDDQEISRYVMRECLPAPAYHVREAQSGEEALQIVPEFHPDVVLLDLMLPGMPGADVLDRLKADHSTRHVPVVVVTSLTLDTEVRRRLSGAAAVVSKSELSRDTLARAVASALAA
jgi:CheY-like chemotaxis protein/anti-sigma regulatory factor (Ser/Thr protein kinase)